MTPNSADRLPVLTEIIDEDWAEAARPDAARPEAEAFHGPDIEITHQAHGATVHRSTAADEFDPLVSLDAAVPLATRGTLPVEAIAALVQAQLDAAVPRLQEWLRVDLAQRLNQELEPRIQALLEIRLAMLARDLALELRPWVEDLAQDAMVRVLDEGLKS